MTAAAGAVLPFHHSFVHKGGVSIKVLGYAHEWLQQLDWL